MHKSSFLLRSVLISLMFVFTLCRGLVFAADVPLEKTATGWLINPNHSPIAVQLQLTGQIDPLSKTVNALLQVRLENEWKTYWRSPGEGGAAPHLSFLPSKNIRDIVWHWPAPRRYSVAGIDTIGYKGEVDFPLTLHLKDLSQPILLKGILTIASCTNFCVLTDYDIELYFTNTKLTLNDNASFLYKDALSSVPLSVTKETLNHNQSAASLTDFITDWDVQTQMLSLKMDKNDGWDNPDIFVDFAANKPDGVDFSAPTISVSGNHLSANMKVTSWAGKLDLNDKHLNFTIVDENFAVELASTINKPNINKELQKLFSMFFVALLGGFILNLMPCVLPVLGMKLSSILSVQEDLKRQQIRKQFIASSAGIISSFWLLAVFLLILKFSGQAVGWGIQFQSPFFISIMVVITALFAANMLGIFTIQLPVKVQTRLATYGSETYLGHYLQGMFATLLATPCSAPFLGTAVAFSLAASALQLFLIFTSLGLGMALPWLLIALFPGMALRLPKPGNWMNSLRTFFALLVLISCYWLLSLLVSFIGLPFTLSVGLLLTAGLLYLIAKKTTKKLFIVVLLALLLSVLGVFVNNRLTSDHSQQERLQWLPLNKDFIEQQVNQGHVVFVDITADWCITCKANKIGVLLQDPVYSALQDKSIITVRGDWTVPSDRISEYIQSYGRFGVPFNIVYGPAAPQGIALPTLLTSQSVLNALQQAKRKMP